MTTSGPSRRPSAHLCAPDAWWPAFAAYSAALLLLLSPLWLNVVEPKWDAIDYSLPSFSYLADAIHQGRFPLWDPWTNCGYPFHAEPQSLTLNPLAIFLGLLFGTPSQGFNLFWGFYWWLGGAGMIFLACRFGAQPAAGFAAGLSYALSGFFIGHAEHTTFVIAAGWLPWIVGCADRAVSRRDPAFALLAALALAASCYGGYPGLVLVTCLFLALWLVLRFLPEPQGEDGDAGGFPRSSRIGWVAGVLVLCGAVLLAVWSPALHAFFVEGGGYTDRVGALTPQQANYPDPFTLAAAVSLFFPFATIVGKSFMGADISMTNAYLGMLTVPFALYWGVRAGWRRGWWLWSLALFFLLASLGGHFGVRTLLYYLYPPLRYIRFSAPLRLFWILPVCLAAALGISDFLRHPEGRRTFLRILLGWGGASGVAAFLFWGEAARGGLLWGDDLSRLFLPALVVLVSGAAIVWFAGGGNGRPKGWLPVALALLVLADMSVHLYNNTGTVWSDREMARKLDAAHVRSTTVEGAPAPRIPGKPFGFLNVQQVTKDPVVQGYTTMLSNGFNTILCESRFVEVLSAPYRFWLSPGAEPLRSQAEALHALSSTGNGNPVPVFVGTVPAGLSAARVVPGSFGAVRINSYAPERIEMTVEVPGGSGALLASTERYAAGWQVLVDGRPGQVQKVNLFFRGALIPPGTHTVTWLYRPSLWTPLVVVSYLTMVIGVAVAVFLLLRQRRGEGRLG